LISFDFFISLISFDFFFFFDKFKVQAKSDIQVFKDDRDLVWIYKKERGFGEGRHLFAFRQHVVT
jgi:hypothetical protein